METARNIIADNPKLIVAAFALVSLVLVLVKLASFVQHCQHA
jgi:preprotein translocase subunit Sec61beta